jgi:hypothetical protein
MRTLKNYLTAAAALALFGFAASLIYPERASAQRGGPATPVQIVAPLPVPISGNVGITGTAAVQVTNTPSVTVAGTPTVTVVNNATNPVPIRNVDNPVQQAVTFIAEVAVPDGSFGEVNSSAFTVPAGKRLVLEYVSGYAFLQPGQKPLVEMTTALNFSGYFHSLTAVPQGDFPAVFARPEAFTINQVLRLYSDGAFPLGIQLTRNASTGLALLQLTFSGYLVDL